VLAIALDENIQSLGEVIVVGYGTQKKTNLTGAVSTVETKVLASRPITDLGRGLQGTVPGLTVTTPSGQIGQNPVIRLRGMTGTLSNEGGAQPLILVDNVEVSSLQMINPEDIESISVLKDAASASIYGARGAWGVILITTKRGKANAPTISYSNNFSWSTPTTTPKVAPAADGAEATLSALRRRSPSQNSFTVLGMSIDEASIQSMRDWEATYGGQDLGREMELGRDFEVRDGGLYFYRSWDPREMFMREWTPQQKHDLSISGGTEKTTYYMGLGYLGQQGVLKVNPDEFNRLNLNLSVSTKVTDWLDTRGKVLYNATEFTRPFYYSSETYDPWYYVTRWPAFYPYGTYQGKPFRNSIDEVAQAKMNDITGGMTRLSIGATVKPVKDLTIDVDYTYDNINNHEHQIGGVLSAINFWSNPTALRYEPYSPASFNKVQYNTDWSHRNTGKAFATYQLTLNNAHAIKIIAGGDVEQYEYWFQMSQRRNVMDPDKGELDLATGDQFTDGARDKWTTLGLFARINYAFKDKYLVELNGRRDGASRLSRNKKWGFFPSMSVGWVVSEEDFMSSLESVVSFAKLRGSYGSIGNQNANPNNIYRIMSTTTSDWLVGGQNMPTTGAPGALPSDLTWETVSTLDIGLDSRFFNDKLGFTFDWYRRTTSDMHSPGVSLPVTFGTSLAGTKSAEVVRVPVRNYGEMQTTGWELAIDYRHSFGNGINVNVTGMLSDFQEKVTKYANTVKSIGYDLIGRVTSHYEGKVLGDIWGYETDRFFTEEDFVDDGTGKMVLKDGIPSQAIYETNGWFFYGPGDIKYKDVNGDGVIDYGALTEGDHGDLRVIGNTT
ncbi:MAG TPA: SusC/RagA family TonB-linked outer membrane protein, partial [Chryseosolibacter sp.]|nr:SusC/RagA family TonB-linked outer membrane protein [Chryseosolibacter sp.]